jgi:hypothetical protein
MSETKLIKLSLVRIDGQTQYRDLVDQKTVKEYADCMRDEAEFPPVRCTFDGTHYWLWDGFHRYMASEAAGFRDIRVEYTNGTQDDAQDLTLGANGRHGLPRNNATKRKQVEAALSMERHAHKSDREIAQLCDVSHKMVGAIRNPEIKEQQDKNRHSSAASKVGSDPTQTRVESNSNASSMESDPTADPTPRLSEVYGPDAEELKAMELAEQADREIFAKLLEADDALQVAHKEILRLNHLVAQKEVRIASLMNEKNATVKQIKSLEHQLVMKSRKGR